MRAYICIGIICELTYSVNDKLRNVLTSPTIDVSFYERIDPAIRMNKIQSTLFTWKTSPMLMHELPSVTTETPICTDVYDEWMNHIEHEITKNFLLKSQTKIGEYVSIIAQIKSLYQIFI